MYFYRCQHLLIFTNTYVNMACSFFCVTFYYDLSVALANARELNEKFSGYTNINIHIHIHIHDVYMYVCMYVCIIKV